MYTQIRTSLVAPTLHNDNGKRPILLPQLITLCTNQDVPVHFHSLYLFICCFIITPYVVLLCLEA